MTRRGRKALWAIGLSALVLSALLALGAAALCRAARARVVFRIASDPPGASVFAGNEYVGVTPVKVSLPEGRPKEVRLVKRGYLDGRASLDPADWRPAGREARPACAFCPTVYDVRVSLAAISASSLALTSNPDGATVFVDGRRAGVTPFVRDNMRPGEYAVRLEHPDCFPLALSVTLEPGQETRRHENLESRVAELYKEMIAKEPNEMAHRSELVHHYVLRGEFGQALEAVRDGMAAARRENVANLARFTSEINHIYTLYYAYPEETETNKIRAGLRELVENAEKEAGAASAQWAACRKQMDRYDRRDGQ